MVYVAPETLVVRLNVKDGLMLALSGETAEESNAGWVQEKKPSGAWGDTNKQWEENSKLWGNMNN